MKRLQLNLNLTGVIVLLAAGVLLPVMLSTAVGIVALVIAKDAVGIVTGVLVVSFTIAAAGSALIAVVLAGRKARLARRQADFVANVSHELRTPLSAIRLYAQTLDSGKLAGDAAKTEQCVRTILRETEWLDVMIDRVLTWRASSADMLQLDVAVQPVAQAVRDAVDRFRCMVTAEEVALSASIESRLPVRHDAHALNAIVLNLLTNAYKYTGDTKHIEVRARDVDEHVVIEVQDNGIGLSPKEAKRVFRAFYRAARHADGSTSGAGLGLAIVKYLLQRQGGTVSVQSEEGVGSIFTIRLPAVREAPDE